MYARAQSEIASVDKVGDYATSNAGVRYQANGDKIVNTIFSVEVD